MGDFTVILPFNYVNGTIADANEVNANFDAITTGHNASMDGATGHGHTGATGDGPQLTASSIDFNNFTFPSGNLCIAATPPGTGEACLAYVNSNNDRVYTFPDVGANADVILSAGDQSIFGSKKFKNGNIFVTPIAPVPSPVFKEGFGFNLAWNGSNWQSANDGANNAYAAILADWVSGVLNFYTAPSTGASDQVVSNATLSTLVRMSIAANGNITFDSGTLFVDAVNNRVGIATTSPTNQLDVIGGIRATSNIINGGFDFILGNTDQVSRGNSGASRALVKDFGNRLHINYNNDFAGGTTFNGSNAYMRPNGELLLPDVDPPTANYANRNAIAKAWGFGFDTGMLLPSECYNIDVPASGKLAEGYYEVFLDTPFATDLSFIILSPPAEDYIVSFGGNFTNFKFNIITQFLLDGTFLDSRFVFCLFGDQ